MELRFNKKMQFSRFTWSFASLRLTAGLGFDQWTVVYHYYLVYYIHVEMKRLPLMLFYLLALLAGGQENMTQNLMEIGH